jgi:hypothetical protein
VLYSSVHLSFRFFLSFARPLALDESSVFLDRISRIRSKNTYGVNKTILSIFLMSKVYIYFIDVLASFCRRFYVWNSTPLLRPRLTFRQWHLTFIIQIAFVAHEQERYVLVIFHTQNLFSAKKRGIKNSKKLLFNWRFKLPKFLRSLEAFVICYGEYAEETLTAPEVVVTNCGIVLLTGSVENVYLYLFSV